MESTDYTPYKNKKATLTSLTARKMKFSMKVFFSKCDFGFLQVPADLVIFTGEILNGKLHFLCSVFYYHHNNNHHITR